jgi:hypothetical protein
LEEEKVSRSLANTLRVDDSTHLFVEAIVIAIAYPRLRDAMTRARASELEVSASLLGTEVAFVGAIAAVILGVTFPDVWYAATVLAGEL